MYNVVLIVAEGNGQSLPVVVVKLPGLPKVVVVGPPVVPVVPVVSGVVDGAEVVVVVPEVVLRVDVRHEAHEDRSDEQPARLKSYLRKLEFEGKLNIHNVGSSHLK